MKRIRFLVTTSSENAGFSPPFFTCLAEGAKSLHGSMSLHFPVNFSPNRFPFAGVIPEKVIWYDHIICLGNITRRVTRL